MTAALAALFLFLVQLLSSYADQPAPAIDAPAARVATEHHQPTTERHQSPLAPTTPPAAPAAPAITADSPTCDDPAAVAGACVTVQLPDETVGRAY
jgi:hypothetical protein